MTTPVQFTLEAAQRISNAVRKVEIGDRAQAPLAFNSFIPQGVKQIAYGHRLVTDFEPWPYGTVRPVRLHGVSKKTPVYGSGNPPPLLGTHEDDVIVQARNMVGNLGSFDVVDLSSTTPAPGPYRRVATTNAPTLILAKAKYGWGNAQTEWVVIGPPPTQTVYGKIVGRTPKNSLALVLVRPRWGTNGGTVDTAFAYNPFGAIGTPLPSGTSLGSLWNMYYVLPGTWVAMVRTSGTVASLQYDWVIVAAECP